MDVHAIAARPLCDLAGDRDAFLVRGEIRAGARPVVCEAWRRSLAHGVNASGFGPQPCSPAELTRLQAREARLLRAVEPGLRSFHQTLADEPHAVAVTNTEGRVLRLLTGGDVDDLDVALSEARYLREGASWHERDIGCNAIGIALVTGTPAMVVGPEHFQATCSGWTTVGAPLRGATGAIAGALGLWLPNGSAHSHTRGWLAAVAQAVEGRLARGAPAARLRHIIEHAPDSTFVQDGQLRYIWSNHRSVPFPADQCVGRTDFDLIERPEDARVVTELKRRVLRDGRRTTADLSLVVRGERRYFHITFEPTRRRSGSVDGVISYVRDVTDERRMRDALRESEARFRALADSIPQLAWMADASGWISWYNQRWYEYTGLSLGECEGWGWTRVHHPDHVERVKHRIRRSWQTGDPWEDTFPLRARDGTYRWFLSRALPFRDADGHVVRWFGTNTDVTDQRALEAARAESEEWLRRITESGMVGVIRWERDGCITYANQYMLDLLGRTASEVERGAVDWRRITPADWTAADEIAVAELRTKGAATPYEKEFLAADGRRVPVLVSAAAFADGTQHGVSLVLDMTEQRRAALELQRLYEQARSAIRQREEVIAFVSHDLRNPLSTVAMASALLLQPSVPAGKKAVQADIIRRSVEQMARLIQDLLDVSRLGANRFRLDLAVEEAGALVAAALQVNGAAAEAAGVRLSLDVQPSLPPVRADRQRVLQVLSNLIANAVAHSPPGGCVTVGAAAGSGCVVFCVQDTGAGIPADEQPFVFDRFWQGRSGGSGSGLGLTICKGIVDAHGGWIDVASEAGRGTTFRFALPEA
jgi:PAS domain S-box-containing protein